MLSTKSLSALAILVPLEVATIPAEAAKTNVAAARAACFQKANETVASVGFGGVGAARMRSDKMPIASAALKRASGHKGEQAALAGL
jgi:hypothetical protein